MHPRRASRSLLLFGVFAAASLHISAQSLKVPTSPDPVIQGYLQEAAADYAVVRVNPAAAFAMPAQTTPLPCDVPRSELVHMVNALGLEDETPEVRRAFMRTMRRLGPTFVKSEYHFENLEVRAVKAQCVKGKLEGDIDLWVTGNFVNDSVEFVGTAKLKRRISFKAVDGKPVGRIRMLSRGANEMVWRDPATEEMMRKSDTPKAVEVWSLHYKGFKAQAPAVTFSFVELSGNHITESTSIVRTLPNGGHEESRYTGLDLSSSQQFKNGEPHGLMVIYPTRDGAIKEKIVNCLRNGEEYKSDPCDVD